MASSPFPKHPCLNIFFGFFGCTVSEFNQGAIASICCSCLPALCAYKCSHAVGLGPKSLGGIKQVPVFVVNQVILYLWFGIVQNKTYYDVDLWFYIIISNALIHHINELYTPQLLRIWNHTLSYYMWTFGLITCVLSIGEHNLKRGVLHAFGRWGSQLKAYTWLSLNHLEIVLLVFLFHVFFFVPC